MKTKGTENNFDLDKSKRILFLCESPEKAKTISKIFRDAGYHNISVMATIGHFDKLEDGSGYHNTGIHPEENFKLDFIIDPNKKDVVNKIKEQVKYAEQVFIASDLDREGEAIAWACVHFLKIPKDKYKRVTYQAINKNAIFEAIKNAGDLDYDMINAAHTRSCLDKGLGYRLSGIARNNVNCKSVGRCQSAALKMIVDREREILDFKPEKYYDLYLHFFKNDVEFKAKYVGTDSSPIKRLNNQEQVDKIYEACKGHPFIVKTVESKDRKENPKPPFSTATFQQECANKLNLTVKQSADCAQKLFDAGKISYHRTDSEVYEEAFKNILLEYVKNNFPEKYRSNTVVEGKKDENEQGAHEAIHVLDLELTPEKFAAEANSDLLAKVYRIIYNRTVAAALAPAIIAQTTYNIYNVENKFTMVSNELKFDGYRTVYAYKDDSDEKETIIKETFKEDEVLKNCSLEALQQETKPKPRYKEASFVKELKEQGIGRPSTYASIIETIKSESRGYCIVEDKCLKPTEKGMQLSEFLDKNFEDLINVGYTRDMEKSLDKISEGKLNYLDFLKEFFDHLENSAKKFDDVKKTSQKICPECGKQMVIRKGPHGPFWGCTGYPKCKHLEALNKK